eukprot:g12387.t1
MKIVRNSGKEGAVVVEKLLLKNDGKGDWRSGYDAQHDVFVDMFESGIVDPTKVVRTALEDAASVAGLLTTTEVLVVENENEA